MNAVSKGLSGITGDIRTKPLSLTDIATAISRATPPPIEYPTTVAESTPALSSTAPMSAAW
jgi:hypothetical protein